jgi:hypothetical protein
MRPSTFQGFTVRAAAPIAGHASAGSPERRSLPASRCLLDPRHSFRRRVVVQQRRPGCPSGVANTPGIAMPESRSRSGFARALASNHGER